MSTTEISTSAGGDRTEVLPLENFVNGARMNRLVAELARFGARPDGGVDRQALTPEDFQARRFLVDVARRYGADVHRDAIGNLFFRRPGTDPAALPVATGSHADSQPTGGKLDGAWGVCAGIEVLAALADAGVSTRRPVEVAVWTNEEGCRFSPGSMGAAAFTDPERLDEFLATADATGRTVGQELAETEKDFADVPLTDLARPWFAFVEAHIEQGPVLEQEGVTIGVVSGIQGTRWYEIDVTGRAAHAGSTPRSHRRDAFRGATAVATEVYAAFDAGDDLLRMTIGRVEVGPGSVNVIPEAVSMTLDVRHPQEEVLDAVEATLVRAVEEQAGAEIRCTMAMSPVEFDPLVRDVVRGSAIDLSFSTRDMGSGAFHDSLHLANHCPTGMVFVPSVDGISHNPAEHTSAEDLVAGTRVLAAAVARLAR